MIKKMMSLLMVASALTMGTSSCDDDDDDDIKSILQEQLLDDADGEYTVKIEPYTTSTIKDKEVMIPDVTSLFGETFKDLPNAQVTHEGSTISIKGGGTKYADITLKDGKFEKFAWRYKTGDSYLICGKTMTPCFNWAGENASNADGGSDTNASYVTLAGYNTITIYMEASNSDFTFDQLDFGVDTETQGTATNESEMSALLKKMIVKKIKKKFPEITNWQNVAENKKTEVQQYIQQARQLFKITLSSVKKSNVTAEE